MSLFPKTAASASKKKNYYERFVYIYPANVNKSAEKVYITQIEQLIDNMHI